MKEEDLIRAVAAWRSMFHEQLPLSADQMNEELFRQASEAANIVTLTVRKYGFEAFMESLRRKPQ